MVRAEMEDVEQLIKNRIKELEEEENSLKHTIMTDMNDECTNLARILELKKLLGEEYDGRLVYENKNIR